MGKRKKKPGGKGTYVYEFCVCDFVQLCDRKFLGGVDFREHSYSVFTGKAQKCILSLLMLYRLYL